MSRFVKSIASAKEEYSALANSLTRVALFFVLGVCCALFGARGEASQAPGPKKPQPIEKDLRNFPLLWGDAIADGTVTPILDREFLSDRLQRLLAAAGPADCLPWRGGDVACRKVRELSYHLVVRFEAEETKRGFVDIHIPESAAPNPPIPSEVAAFHGALKDALAQVSKLGGLTPQADASRADILIHVNMSERLQTSVGFDYESMPSLAQRVDRSEACQALESFEYLLPWTIVRWNACLPRKAGYPKTPRWTIEGGEIWIEFPRRAFWQAELARLALDHARFASAFGLGESRDAIVSRFRSPSKTTLQPVTQAIRLPRPTEWLGAGRVLQGRRQWWSAPRPAETLLSLATAAFQSERDALDGPGGDPSGRCGEESHAQILEGRLRRALAMFVAGIRAGGLQVSPLGDYTSEFQLNREGVIADFSLVGWQGSFDQRLDDELVAMLLDNALAQPDESAKSFAGASRQEALIAKLVDSQGDKMKDALRRVAIGMTGAPGGSCSTLMEQVPSELLK